MNIFDTASKTLIQTWDQTIKEPVKIKLIATDHAENSQFANFTRQMADATSKLVIESEKGEKDLPGFLLKENITYSALPLKKELDPFLDALSQVNGTPPMLAQSDLSENVQSTLDKIDIPVRLTLYIALECPHCPNVVRTVIPIALNCKNINLHIIDGSLFSETAQKDGVMSAPCLILDDDFRWTGNVTADEIVNMIVGRDPSQLSAGTLKNILEQGDASWIARQMIEKQNIFDAFIKLLLHDTWSVRLGAMVIVEELAETDPKLAARLCPVLISLFDETDPPVQGDILYALGETGDRKTADWIKEKLAELDHEDLVDAAKEALETLETNNG
ncbi:thioredoxin family protein [Desulfobacula toluolica]|uniref:Putative electron carrier protein related to glutaredoxin n=1 Tax=Desulfobacula toluolica (strain DSM 7467 / Tol2) TaxID=651182 RepID=K0NCW0_DESTT|nr:thioredoxin family protein [Desulfobacula toluolica]CCK78716.1 putative electron carrier protein related to glutaredoxin [Desulfobacula toluolica Tol2]